MVIVKFLEWLFKSPKNAILAFLTGITLTSFAQTKIEVEVLAPLINPDKPLYIALDYNNWNPGDSKYILKKESDKVYSILLENAPASFEFKFTQGSWMYVEGTPDGQSLPNHSFDRTVQKGNFQKTSILGWERQVVYDLIIEQIPENTPKDSKIYIAGNFNNWDAGNPDFELRRNINGQYVFKLYTDLQKIEYKFTRGSWETVEARESGKARPNRTIFRDSSIDNKAVTCQIEGWEDLLGTLHVYSLFDFLLLFSVFQGLMLLIAVPLTQKTNTEANQWLLASVFVASVSILLYLVSNFQVFVNRFPRIVVMADFVYFLYGPLFYFYLIKLLFHNKKLPGRWYLFFIPFLIQFFAYLPFIIQNDKTFLLELMEQKPMLEQIFGGAGIIGLMWNIFFWVLYRRLIAAYKKQFENTLSYEQNLNYLNLVLILQFLVLCFWAFSMVLALIGKVTKLENVILVENSTDLIWLMFSFTTFIVGFFAIHHHEIEQVPGHAAGVAFEDMLESRISSTPQFNIQPQQEDFSEDIEKLEKYIESEKPYKNPKISLSELASEIGISSHLLSRIINDHYQQNFFDFINSFRVEEFKKMVKDPKNQNYTFLGLAFEVGFNSKTAFNRAFKKITNLTPRDYLDSFKN